MTTISTKISGAWKKVKVIYIKVHGSWYPLNFTYVKIGGVWKLTYLRPGFAHDRAILSEVFAIAMSRGLSEIAVISDSVSKDYSKATVDTTTATEVITKTYGKEILDIVVSAETLVIFTDKVVTEAVTLLEGIGKDVSKPLATDVSNTVESISHLLEKQVEESVSSLDSAVISTGKVLLDVVNVLETLDITYQLLFGDTFVTSEAFSKVYGGAPLDSLLFNENVALTMNRTTSESLTLSEMFELTRLITYGDNVSFAEDLSIFNEKGIDEPVTINEVATIAYFNYMDTTYLDTPSDYVVHSILIT